MQQATVVYWRDIPAQVIVGKGRTAAKVQLAERFEQAIDRAAMKAGLAGTDDYLSEWRRASIDTAPMGIDQELARAVADEIEREYDQVRLRALIENKGWA